MGDLVEDGNWWVQVLDGKPFIVRVDQGWVFHWGSDGWFSQDNYIFLSPVQEYHK